MNTTILFRTITASGEIKTPVTFSLQKYKRVVKGSPPWMVADMVDDDDPLRSHLVNIIMSEHDYYLDRL